MTAKLKPLTRPELQAIVLNPRFKGGYFGSWKLTGIFSSVALVISIAFTVIFSLPFAIPAATSNNTTSPNSFRAIKCANVPPICPAPIKVIFFLNVYPFYFIVGIVNSGLDLNPEGHLEVIVLSLV